MSSLLTNNSAMVALQTLKTINKDLGSVQGQISTGKKIATARDNAALWGISTTMQTDVSGFKAISESLSLGSATLSVARDGAETIASLLDTMKGKIVAAQEDNVDRDKIQADVAALRDQIKTVVDAASFNGLNLLKRNLADNSVSVLASLNRDSNQAVTASNISFERRTLEVTTASAGATVAAGANADIIVLGADAAIANTIFVAGDMISVEVTNATTKSGFTFAYRVTEADLGATASVGALGAKVEAAFIDQAKVAESSGAFDTSDFTIDYKAATGGINIDIAAGGVAIEASQTSLTGGLSALDMVDVTTKQGAKAALSAIEPLIQNAIDAAASFGSAQGRIQTQSEYVGKIMDGLTSGIGALVDADMEQASARLQALQVQQQLGVQALSIANQSPQNILALFR